MSAARWLRIKGSRRSVAAGVPGRVRRGQRVLVSAVDGRRAAPDPGDRPGERHRAEMVSRDFRHVETRMDRTIWVLEADRAEILKTGETAHVKVTWFGETGEVTVVITSAEGTVDFGERTAELRGDVRVERRNGAVLRTGKRSAGTSGRNSCGPRRRW